MQKTSPFGSHFEFRHFANLKHPLMQKITPDSDSTPNLAIEKLGFVYYFEKRFECAHPYRYSSILVSVVISFDFQIEVSFCIPPIARPILLLILSVQVEFSEMTPPR